MTQLVGRPLRRHLDSAVDPDDKAALRELNREVSGEVQALLERARALHRGP
jgi:hypothetical protein